MPAGEHHWESSPKVPVRVLHAFSDSGVSPGCLLGKEKEPYSIAVTEIIKVVKKTRV